MCNTYEGCQTRSMLRLVLATGTSAFASSCGGMRVGAQHAARGCRTQSAATPLLARRGCSVHMPALQIRQHATAASAWQLAAVRRSAWRHGAGGRAFAAAAAAETPAATAPRLSELPHYADLPLDKAAHLRSGLLQRLLVICQSTMNTTQI